MTDIEFLANRKSKIPGPVSRYGQSSNRPGSSIVLYKEPLSLFLVNHEIPESMTNDFFNLNRISGWELHNGMAVKLPDTKSFTPHKNQ